MVTGPRRLLTDWTTNAGVDGTGLLALVLGGATAEGIHLATLGYETFVLHPDDAAAGSAEQAAHVHPVVADPAALPGEWTGRFDLVVAIDTAPAVDQVAPSGLLFTTSADPLDAPEGVVEVLGETVEDPAEPGRTIHRAVWARLSV